jgi:hypothetical protein
MPFRDFSPSLALLVLPVLVLDLSSDFTSTAAINVGSAQVSLGAPFPFLNADDSGYY